MTDTPLAIPSIHLNGTSAETLLSETKHTLQAVSRAIEALCLFPPNARDYYVQGPEAFLVAHQQYEVRLEKLKSIRRELQAIFEAIEDGGFKVY